MEKELDKLGTVLAIQNEITKDALAMLNRQQKRQTHILWSAMAFMGMALLIAGISVYFSFASLNKLADQVNHNTQLSIHNAEVIEHEHAEKTGAGLSQ